MATDVVGSNMPAENKYGQNGYGGASSDLPGQKTSIAGFGKQDVPLADYANKQTRDLGGGNVPTTFGMKGPAAAPQIGSTPKRPVTTR